MKNLFNLLKSFFFSKKKKADSNVNSNVGNKNEFDFTIISKEERLSNRCDKYEFIID